MPLEENFLLNTYETKIIINYVIYRSVEHFIQCSKFKDIDIFREVEKANTGKEALEIGQKVSKNSPEKIVDNWDQIKNKLLREATKAKFFQNKSIGQKLLHTEGYIEIKEPTSEPDWDKQDNKIGKVVMSTRNELINTFGMNANEEKIESTLKEDAVEDFIQGIKENDIFDASYQTSIEDKYMYEGSDTLVSYLLQINGLRGEIVILQSLDEERLPISHSIYKAGDNLYDIRGKFSSVSHAMENLHNFKDKNISTAIYKAKKHDSSIAIPAHIISKGNIPHTMRLT